MPNQARTDRIVNRFFGILIPIALIGAAGYSIWVVTVTACVNYLLKAADDQRLSVVPKRQGTAIAILVVFFILISLWALAYFRILLTIASNPGYTEKRPLSTSSSEEKDYDGPILFDCSGRPPNQHRRDSAVGPVIDRQGILEGRVTPPPGLSRFYNRDAFVSEGSGLPIFCNRCNNWKPIRAHHCSQVDRCVRRMDHFCPWIGGVVSETTVKFFVQMTVYGFLFSGFLLSVFAWLVYDQSKRINVIDGNWVAMLALGAVFMIICFGMSLHNIQLGMKNRTTVEELGRVYFMAIHIDNPARQATTANSYYHTITYPLRPSTNPHSNQALRTFAVVQTKQTDNPWNLGHPLDNLRSIMGDRFIDWILPLKYPPCCFHDDPESDYSLGPDVERLKRDYGLISGDT